MYREAIFWAVQQAWPRDDRETKVKINRPSFLCPSQAIVCDYVLFVRNRDRDHQNLRLSHFCILLRPLLAQQRWLGKNRLIIEVDRRMLLVHEKVLPVVRVWQILTYGINEACSAKVCLNAAYCKTLWTGCIFNPHTKGPGLCDKICQRIMGVVSASQVWHLLTIQDFPPPYWGPIEEYVFSDKIWEPGKLVQSYQLQSQVHDKWHAVEIVTKHRHVFDSLLDCARCPCHMLHLSTERCVTGGKDVDLLSVSEKWRFLAKFLVDWIPSRLIVQTAVSCLWGNMKTAGYCRFSHVPTFSSNNVPGLNLQILHQLSKWNCSVLLSFRHNFESQRRSPLQTLHNVCEDVKWEAFLDRLKCLNLFDTCCPGLAIGNISACVSRVRFALSRSRALTFASGSMRSSSESSVLGRAANLEMVHMLWAQKRIKKPRTARTSGTSGISLAAFGACWLRISQKPQSRQEAFTEIIVVIVLWNLSEIVMSFGQRMCSTSLWTASTFSSTM